MSLERTASSDGSRSSLAAMRFVVARAFRVALARSILVFGFLDVVFTVFAVAWRDRLDGPVLLPPGGLVMGWISNPSPWDIPLAFSIAAASVLVAVLIHPKRSSADRFANLS